MDITQPNSYSPGTSPSLLLVTPIAYSSSSVAIMLGHLGRVTTQKH